VYAKEKNLPVEEARKHPNTTVVERVPKPGKGVK